MKKLKKNSKNRGGILPFIIFIITIFVWLFSLIILNYTNEVEEFKDRKKTNEEYWNAENISVIGEYELYKGNQAIQKGEYKDIIEYFEGKEKVWLEKNLVSPSGYKRRAVIHNLETIENKLALTPFSENELKIKLEKIIEIDKIKYKINVNLYYKYPYKEIDFFKSSIRKIEGVEIYRVDENFKN